MTAEKHNHIMELYHFLIIYLFCIVVPFQSTQLTVHGLAIACACINWAMYMYMYISLLSEWS